MPLEMKGGIGRYREMWGDMGRCRGAAYELPLEMNEASMRVLLSLRISRTLAGR